MYWHKYKNNDNHNVLRVKKHNDSLAMSQHREELSSGEARPWRGSVTNFGDDEVRSTSTVPQGKEEIVYSGDALPWRCTATT